MKPRHLLSTVERLPTINEMQESNREDEDLEYSSHTMEEYVNSIKELSQPAPFPLHGPSRAPPLDDISLTLTDPSHCDSSPRVNQNLLDRLAAQTLFSGLV
ncbi:Isocitrate dehydrogenase kinase/phosphatase [Dissostichus eleginoides]|uniref:Isocitrate dehydrogenase kinase/phosphatase n=1 Tax=Dissostichus eleginoides TaxID=100907 RepID=A0AAD9BMQ7_DISEL|nr:Isocitrate dehydrogenase kinase/phosphatase [Dissostichus eleginoides]